MQTLTTGYGLIEGPVWDPARGLLFSDVLFGGVYCLPPDPPRDSGVDATAGLVFEHRRGIGGMALHETDGVVGGVVVSGRNISVKPFDGGDTILLLDRDEANGCVGFNDITADAAGRIYAGGLGSSPVFEDGRGPQPGDLYLIDLDGTARVVADDVLLTNGLAFSPDGATLYHSDSGRRAVMSYSVQPDGSVGPKETFVETDRGVPDGLVVAQDGSVWVALAGGGHGVGVFAADGSERDFVEIPDPMCTSVCFGGADLHDLYIVSGSEGLDTDRGGSVYRLRTDVAGLPVGEARIGLT